jgi:hypothetical protein
MREVASEFAQRSEQYRLVDPERWCWRLRTSSLNEVRKNLAASLTGEIARDDAKREIQPAGDSWVLKKPGGAYQTA